MARHDEKTQPSAPTPGPTPGGTPASAGKGRPTPKRSESERGRRRPVAAPATGKEAAKLRRLEQAEQRTRVRQAWIAGDEKNMPARDRGPVRRFVRDSIDARLTVTEWFVPVAIVLYLASIFGGKTLAPITLLGMMFLTFFVVLELTVVGFQLRRKLRKKFGSEIGKGAVRYGLLRATQLRRFRLPRAQVKRFADVG